MGQETQLVILAGITISWSVANGWSKYRLRLHCVAMHCGLMWPVGILIIFQKALTVPLQSPYSRQMCKEGWARRFWRRLHFPSIAMGAMGIWQALLPVDWSTQGKVTVRCSTKTYDLYQYFINCIVNEALSNMSYLTIRRYRLLLKPWFELVLSKMANHSFKERLFTCSVPSYYCPACRTTLVATRFRVAVICPIIQVPHCIRVFFYFVWFVFINHIFQFYNELCTYCNILDIYLS